MEAFSGALLRMLQSSHLHFLLGAGASAPVIRVAGNVEADILQLVKDGKRAEAEKRTLEFLSTFVEPMTALLAEAPPEAVARKTQEYKSLILAVDAILAARATNLLPRQASIFTTNYDLFLERASEECTSIILNDGFNRVPSLKNEHRFAPERLFDATHHTGNHYDYTAELPSINLVKLHGSMTWKQKGQDVVFKTLSFDDLKGSVQSGKTDILKDLSIVLPTLDKFEQTTLQRIYYDLLRIFANVMERENSLVITFGFSFRDEHIFEIVKRALRNPTLQLVVCCYATEEIHEQEARFSSFNNVTILVPRETGGLDFNWLVALLSGIPGKRER